MSTPPISNAAPLTFSEMFKFDDRVRLLVAAAAWGGSPVSEPALTEALATAFPDTLVGEIAAIVASVVREEMVFWGQAPCQRDATLAISNAP